MNEIEREANLPEIRSDGISEERDGEWVVGAGCAEEGDWPDCKKGAEGAEGFACWPMDMYWGM